MNEIIAKIKSFVSLIYNFVVTYILLALKILLLIMVMAISVEVVLEGWFYSSYLSWKIGATTSTIGIIIFIIITWKLINFSEKWAITLIFPIVLLISGTIIYGVENEGGPFFLKQGNPRLINIIFMIVALGVSILFIVNKKITKIVKLLITTMAILSIIGFTIPIILQQNLQQSLQGQASIILGSLPFFLRPTFLGLFLSFPVMLIFLIYQFIVSVKTKEQSNRVNTIYPMVPVILLLIIGVKTLIFSAPVEKIFSLEEFAGKKGRCNIASHEEGGHIVSFSSQKDFNDNAVFNLIDGDISQKGWQSEEGSPFPHEIVIALPGASPQKINQIIIFTGGNQSTPSVPKDIEFYISSSNKLDNFISVGTMTCRQTSLPQVYNFKKEM